MRQPTSPDNLGERHAHEYFTFPSLMAMATPARRHHGRSTPGRRPHHSPAQAEPAPQAPTDSGITVSGSYNPGGSGCHGKENSAECLSRGLRVPSTIAPKQELTVTVEADSVPGQRTWTCSSTSRVAGTAAFFHHSANGELKQLASSGLGAADQLVYDKHGLSAGFPTNVNCTPEHLSLTYKIDSLVREEGSYLDLSIGTTVAAPGADARSYTFSPKITTSVDGTPQTPTTTAQKPAASTPHATVTTEKVTIDDAAKDAGRFTMKARNDSTTPLSDFTIDVSRSRGQAQVTALTCDLTAFGGEVVSAKGPAERLKVSSGKAKVPEGKEITCQVDLTGVVGRNTFKAALTTGGQTFSSDYVNDRPVGEVSVKGAQSNVEAAPTGTFKIDYTVTFTNKTDADGYNSKIVLRPQVPTDFTLKSVTGTGTPRWIHEDDFIIQPDNSVPLPTDQTLYANSSTTMTFTNIYTVNADAITEEGWKALGTCNPQDPSQGLTTRIDVAGSYADIEAGTYSTCTTVTRTKN